MAGLLFGARPLGRYRLRHLERHVSPALPSHPARAPQGPGPASGAAGEGGGGDFDLDGIRGALVGSGAALRHDLRGVPGSDAPPRHGPPRHPRALHLSPSAPAGGLHTRPTPPPRAPRLDPRSGSGPRVKARVARPREEWSVPRDGPPRRGFLHPLPPLRVTDIPALRRSAPRLGRRRSGPRRPRSRGDATVVRCRDGDAPLRNRGRRRAGVAG
mmetsp:Transcript_68346/g.157065  ORF Transcript_68346/g.157065 Transcript_68346/m.157065 type:complete len:214 (+) Transcript_68346:142-783(+)